MNIKLYIDDIRNPKGSFDYVARSSSLAIAFMDDIGCADFISFDFDLSGDDRAITVVKWMVEMDLDNPGWIPEDFTWFTHSANPVGKAMIDGYLNSYLRTRK